MANAFGAGRINIGSGNKIYFSHAQASGPQNTLSLATGVVAVLNTNATVGKLLLNGVEYTSGSFSATTHSTFFQGTGTLTVSQTTGLTSISAEKGRLHYDGGNLHFGTPVQLVTIYNAKGQKVLNQKVYGGKLSILLPKGVYLVQLKDTQTTTNTKLAID